MPQQPHPIQPLVDVAGVQRFQQNNIVRFLLDWAQPRGMGLNELARMSQQPGANFTHGDWQQLAQLIGYSLSGYAELSYVDDEAYHMAQNQALPEPFLPVLARNEFLAGLLSDLRSELRGPIAKLYEIHPDDLKGT